MRPKGMEMKSDTTDEIAPAKKASMSFEGGSGLHLSNQQM